MCTACQPTCFAPHMLISGHIFIMPQRRFKFKLCRLVRGERSLNSLPIIQLLLPSLNLPHAPSAYLVHSVVSICCFWKKNHENLSCQGEFSLSILFAPVKVLKLKSHTCSSCIFVIFFSPRFNSECLCLCFLLGYHWLEEFCRWVAVLFASGFSFRREEGCRASYSPHQQTTEAAVWSFVSVYCRFLCLLWGRWERKAEDCINSQST